MTFKEFRKWCNQRACDGYWGIVTASACISIMKSLQSVPFWRREKVWKREFENSAVNEIVIPIENKIKEKENEY